MRKSFCLLKQRILILTVPENFRENLFPKLYVIRAVELEWARK